MGTTHHTAQLYVLCTIRVFINKHVNCNIVLLIFWFVFCVHTQNLYILRLNDHYIILSNGLSSSLLLRSYCCWVYFIVGFFYYSHRYCCSVSLYIYVINWNVHIVGPCAAVEWLIFGILFAPHTLSHDHILTSSPQQIKIHIDDRPIKRLLVWMGNNIHIHASVEVGGIFHLYSSVHPLVYFVL